MGLSEQGGGGWRLGTVVRWIRRVGANPTGTGGRKDRSVAPRTIIVCALVFIVGTLVLLYALWQFWPPAIQNKDQRGVGRFFHFHFIKWDFYFTRDKSILVIVAVAGALGAMFYVLRSFFQYVGKRKLVYSWLIMYFLTPIAGAVMATAVYVLLRAGLLTGPNASIGDPAGFVAVAFLVGMFMQQAAEKLKKVFEALFAETQKHGDEITGPEIQDFDPKKGPIGTVVTIVGTDFVEPVSVTFGETPAVDVTFDSASKIRATIAAGTPLGPATIRITAGGTTVTFDEQFVVEAPRVPNVADT
jgi:hypothetical protein